MAYVPPHKRLSSTQVGSPPTPELLVPQMKKNLGFRTDKHASRVKQIAYADHAISRCLAVPLQDDDQIPSSVHLVPVSSESIKWKGGWIPLTLVDDHSSQQESRVVKDRHLQLPWVSVAEKVHLDLLSAFQNVKDEMASASLEKIKPGFFARFGKVLFHRNPYLSVEQLKECSISEARLRDLRRVFRNDVPISYVEHIKSRVVPEIGIDVEGEKEQYYVKLADTEQPGSFIICKCRIQEGAKKLELYNIESRPLRHLIVDVSCLDSHVDLRLALRTIRDITAITDEERQNIGNLISSAILDHNVKGGLRWPLGVANSGARYSVIGACHTRHKFYRNSSVRFKVKEVDRYDFLSSTGDVTREAELKLTGIARYLMGEENDAKEVSTLLEDALKMIWDHFLNWDGSLVSYNKS